MYSFRNDYSEGAHPKVLQALADTNLRQTVGYAAAKPRRIPSAASAPRRMRRFTSWWAGRR